jgi:hypothetical protein
MKNIILFGILFLVHLKDLYGWLIENRAISLTFNETTGALTHIVDKSTQVDVVGNAAGTTSLINFVVVGDDVGEVQMKRIRENNETRNGMTNLAFIFA